VGAGARPRVVRGRRAGLARLRRGSRSAWSQTDPPSPSSSIVTASTSSRIGSSYPSGSTGAGRTPRREGGRTPTVSGVSLPVIFASGLRPSLAPVSVAPETRLLLTSSFPD